MVLKGVFSESEYVCVPTCQISSFQPDSDLFYTGELILLTHSSKQAHKNNKEEKTTRETIDLLLFHQHYLKYLNEYFLNIFQFTLISFYQINNTDVEKI